jgi:hypothetical protein
MRKRLLVGVLAATLVAAPLACSSSVTVTSGSTSGSGGLPSGAAATGPTTSSSSVAVTTATGPSSSTSGPGGGSASTSSAGGFGGAFSVTSTASTGGAGGAPVCGPPAPMCNAPGQCGSVVPLVQVPSEPLPSTGGVVADGTYILTELTEYTGPGGASGPTGTQITETLVLANGEYQVSGVVGVMGSPPMPEYSGGTFTTMAAAFTIEPACPTTSAPEPNDYSASATQFRLVTSSGNVTDEGVYSRIQ